MELNKSSTPKTSTKTAPKTKIDFIVDLPEDDTSSTTTITKIVFGSCHKNKYATSQIWNTIKNENPIAFLWTGDAIYPPIRNIASLSDLEKEYTQLRYNSSIGYSDFLTSSSHYYISIFGTYDDHDYGGNDRGHDMTQRQERSKLFYNFINKTIPMEEDKKEREGVYYSVEFRHHSSTPTTTSVVNSQTQQTVRILFLDTRYYRSYHCLPSIAGQFPLGAGMACLTRWASAGLLRNYCHSKHQNDNTTETILGPQQWEWLQNQIYNLPSPDILIVVSSIQVYTTNPAMESWGQFPNELQRLSKMLLYAASRNSIVTIISGDVHHGEIIQPFPTTMQQQSSSSSNQPPYLEVTSSGLTHDCSKHIYGIVCVPLLQTFHLHRFMNNINNYYIGRNYGTINIDWKHQNISINVHDAITGTIQLTTGSRSFMDSTTANDVNNVDTEMLLNSIIPCMDNHLVPYFYRGSIVIVVLLVTTLLLFYNKHYAPFRNSSRSHLDNCVAKKKKA